jgi:hypothetical protein
MSPLHDSTLLRATVSVSQRFLLGGQFDNKWPFRGANPFLGLRRIRVPRRWVKRTYPNDRPQRWFERVYRTETDTYDSWFGPNVRGEKTVKP